MKVVPPELTIIVPRALLDWEGNIGAGALLLRTGALHIILCHDGVFIIVQQLLLRHPPP
jgi:hypothetical protein